MSSEILNALVGGVLIGLAVSLMLLGSGRVTGISGIIFGIFRRDDRAWKIYFLVGLLGGGLTFQIFKPGVFTGALASSDWTVAIAGLLVGFGTTLGSGCTSGHGVCGISRLSPRSIVATVLFMAAGIFSVFIFRQVGILP
ncbi:MAG: YeeE/YedE family protein [Bdellovibrionales bacterium]